MSKPNFASDFDLGTSPHGLSVGHELPHQETGSAESPSSLVDGVPSAPMVAALAATEAAGKPEVFVLTEDQRCHLAYAALCQIGELEDCYESEEPEVQTGIRLLIEARDILMVGRYSL